MAKPIKETKAAKSIFTLEETNRKKLKVASAITGREMQDIVNQALTMWFNHYEKTNGVIPTK